MTEHEFARHETDRRMRKVRHLVPAVATALAAFPLATALLGSPAAHASTDNIGFGFNAPQVSGAPTGAVFLTGGGVFNPSTGFVHSAGGFRCTSAVNQGPLTGCETGEGVRWDTANLLRNTGFTCTGEAEPAAFIDGTTVVLLADFYRAGDGNDESFTAKMIVSSHDFAPNQPGVQNVWIQGVGCGSAVVNFAP